MALRFAFFAIYYTLYAKRYTLFCTRYDSRDTRYESGFTEKGNSYAIKLYYRIRRYALCRCQKEKYQNQEEIKDAHTGI